MGDEANKPVHSSHPALPWDQGEHMLVRQGQLMFIARTNPRDDSNNPWAGYTTVASMQHLNAMALAGWSRARHKLQMGHAYLPDGIRLSLEEFDSLREDDIMDYFGKREDDIPEENHILKQACKLLHLAEFKYLMPGTMMMYWNWYGSVNNISYGVSPQARVNYSTVRTLVVNYNIAKTATLSNVWGDQKKLVEGSKFGLVCRRRTTAEGTPGAPEIVPWAELDLMTPPMVSRAFTDEMNRNLRGYYIALGTCTELSGKEISERKRRDAIGNNGKPSAVVHDAYGTLPQFQAQLRL